MPRRAKAPRRCWWCGAAFHANLKNARPSRQPVEVTVADSLVMVHVGCRDEMDSVGAEGVSTVRDQDPAD